MEASKCSEKTTKHYITQLGIPSGNKDKCEPY